jgi:hypothetical protein
MTTTLTARIDCTLLRGQNNREHHRARAARVVAEREATRLALSSGDWRGDAVSLRRPELGARVTIVRPFVSTALDSDNLSAACKAVRDEVAAFLGVDDASPRLHWVYLQAPAAVLGSSVKAAVVNRRGRVTRKATTRPSKDHDTRPLLRIEVLPVGDIDPQAQALAQAEAREWALGVQVAAQAHRLRLAEAVVEAARDWRECGCEHPACNFCIDDADTAAALAAWDAVPGDVGPVDLG